MTKVSAIRSVAMRASSSTARTLGPGVGARVVELRCDAAADREHAHLVPGTRLRQERPWQLELESELLVCDRLAEHRVRLDRAEFARVARVADEEPPPRAALRLRRAAPPPAGEREVLAVGDVHLA